MTIKRILFAQALITLLTTQAFGWGAKGHEIVATTGAGLATAGGEFWQANSDGMKQLTTVPDRSWKSGSSSTDEKPNHWFQVDSYFSDASQLSQFPKVYSSATDKYGEDTIIKNGTAPWRIAQFYTLALAAAKSGDSKTFLEYAGVMSHYIGDLSQPLHVSENYDGADTDNTGIHKFFETDNIKDEEAIAAEVQTRAQALLANADFLKNFEGDMIDISFNEVERAIAYRDQILNTDTQLGRTGDGADKQLELAKDRMADGAATLSIILSKLWTDSGQVLQATPVPIDDPEWVAPDFSGGAQLFTPVHAVASTDDCAS